jgi:hypothetical protein
LESVSWPSLALRSDFVFLWRRLLMPAKKKGGKKKAGTKRTTRRKTKRK